MTLKKNIHLIVIISLLFSCSPKSEGTLPEDLKEVENLTVYTADETPLFQMDLQEVARIDDSNDVLLGRITWIKTDESGHIFISDDGEKRINMYTPDGDFITSLGRKGQGPGEFEYVHNLVVDETHVYAMDFSKNLINTYFLDSLEFDTAIMMIRDDQRSEQIQGYYPSGFHVLANGEFLVTYMKSFGINDTDSQNRVELVYKVNRDGRMHSEPVLELKIVEPVVLRTENSVSVFGTPFSESLETALSPSRRIVVNRTDRFLFQLFDENGRYERAFYYPFSNKPLTRERALNQYDNENYQRAIRNYDLPETWPAIDTFLLDDEGRFWIATIIDDEEMLEWWVLDEQGELLAKQIWPKNQQIEHVWNNYVFMLEEDEMGLVEVVKYQLSLM